MGGKGGLYPSKDDKGKKKKKFEDPDARVIRLDRKRPGRKEDGLLHKMDRRGGNGTLHNWRGNRRRPRITVEGGIGDKGKKIVKSFPYRGAHQKKRVSCGTSLGGTRKWNRRRTRVTKKPRLEGKKVLKKGKEFLSSSRGNWGELGRERPDDNQKRITKGKKRSA